MSGTSPFRLLAILGVLGGCGLDPRVIGGDEASISDSTAEAPRSLDIRAYLHDGNPASGARVEIWSTDSSLPRLQAGARCDSLGRASLRLPSGNWSVVVRDERGIFQRRIGQEERILDTLRAPGTLMGIVRGGAGQEVSIPGMGARTWCDSLGFFRLDSLGAGELDLVVGSAGRRERATVVVRAGDRSMALGRRDSLPAAWPTLPADSLIAWGDPTTTLRPPRGSLGYRGEFSLAVRLRRIDTVSALQVLSWTDGLSQGVKIGWRGMDTLLLTVDGRTFVGIGVRLDTGSRQVGVSWQEERLRVLVDSQEVVSLAYATAASRGEWSTPTIGAQGVRMEWVAFRRGVVETDWFLALSRR